MQYDLDQFLSQYEFTPSNIHLSNFLKQLFNDELEEEKKRIGRANTPQGPGEIVPSPGATIDQEVDEEDGGGEEAEEIISQVDVVPQEAGPQVALPVVANGKADQTLQIQLSA